METLHPELWKEIFSDNLYIIDEKQELAKAINPVKTDTIKTEKTATVSVQIPVSPSIPTKAVKNPDVSLLETKVNNTPTLKPEGTYSNGVLILLHESLPMTAAQQEMLSKIVKAVQLNLAECGIIKTAVPVSLKELEILNPKFLLSFGIPRDAFSPTFSKEYYSIQKYNSTIVLLSDALGNLEKTDTLKRNLWNTLKDMFGIK
jgi:hypothetical protein